MKLVRKNAIGLKHCNKNISTLDNRKMKPKLPRDHKEMLKTTLGQRNNKQQVVKIVGKKLKRPSF